MFSVNASEEKENLLGAHFQAFKKISKIQNKFHSSNKYLPVNILKNSNLAIQITHFCDVFKHKQKDVMFSHGSFYADEDL